MPRLTDNEWGVTYIALRFYAEKTEEDMDRWDKETAKVMSDNCKAARKILSKLDKDDERAQPTPTQTPSIHIYGTIL